MARQPRIVIQPSRNKQTFVSVRGSNGEKVANTETYKTPGGARKDAERIADIVKNAKIVDNTKKSS